MPDSTSAPVRDLGSNELWEASLERSRHRRRFFEDVRRRRNWQRGASVVLSAGLLGPTASPALAAATMGGQNASDGGTGTPNALTAAAEGAQLLGLGSRGPAVAAVQSKLRSTLPSILVDGVFGPQTEGAVRAFQRAHGLAVTGRVDARTWSALFRAGVVFYDGRTAAEKAHEAVAPPTQQRLQVAGDAAAANLKVNASPPANASPSVNASPSANASPPAKASPPVEASTPVKASPPVEASAPVKASPPVDASPAVKASPPAETPVARKAVTPAPALAPAPTDADTPALAHASALEIDPGLKPHAEPASKSDAEAAPKADAEPAPKADPAPAPEPAPEAEPTPVAKTDPVPTDHPAPAPEPAPRATGQPVSAPAPSSGGDSCGSGRFTQPVTGAIQTGSFGES